MANTNPVHPVEQNDDDTVHGKDLLTRGLDFFFGKVGDAIHGATQKDKPQAKVNPQATDVETTGEATDDEASGSGSETPPKGAA